MTRERTGTWLGAAACVALMGSILAACDDGSSSPALTGSPATTVAVGQPYRFQPRAVNLNEGRSVRFTIANKPSWASFDNSTGQLSGTPTPRQTGLFRGIQIGLIAGTVHASLPPFSITVVPPAPTPAPASAATAVTISWQAPTENTNGSVLSNLSGYKIYYGGASGEYSSSIDISNPGLTSYVVQNLPAGEYFFAVTAYNSAGEESGLSPEVSTMLN